MWNKLTVQGGLATAVWAMFFILVLIWMLVPPKGDPSQLALLNALIMVFGSAALNVSNYYFGSSSGSTSKDETIKTVALGTGNGNGNGNGNPPVPLANPAP